MRVKLAKTAGFCMGVKRALDKVLDESVKGGRRVYTYGPLIHNRQAVEMLKRKGIEPKEDFREGDEGIVVIRAHGVPPSRIKELENAGMEVVDATCPNVLKSQSYIRRYARRGFAIIIVGDRDHAEVISLLGHCGERSAVVSTPAEAQTVPAEGDVCVVAQTTFNESLYNEIAEIIRARATGEPVVVKSICRSTEERQREVQELARTTDAVVVVGGRNSANTCRLAEIAGEAGAPSFHVETAVELDLEQLRGYSLVGVTAGASTPNWITQEVIERIEAYGRAELGVLRWTRALLSTAVRSNAYTALGALAITYAVCLLLGITSQLWAYGLIAFAYIFSVYTWNRAVDPREETTHLPPRVQFYQRHRHLLNAVSLTLTVLALAVSALVLKHRTVLIVLLAVAYVLGAIYAIRLLPLRRGRLGSLKDIPASKDLFAALGWTLVAAVIPCVGAYGRFTRAGLLTSAALFVIVLARQIAYDLIDIRGDRLLGEETLPVLVGERRSRTLVISLAAAGLALCVIGVAAGSFGALAWWLLLSPVLPAAYLYLNARRGPLSELACSLSLDGALILAGLIGAIWVML